MRILSYVVLGVLQIALLPLAIPALLVAGYKQIIVSKRLGASQTGIKVLNGRWMMHRVGIREDAAAGSLQGALPNTSSAALWVALFPLWVQARLGGRPVFPRVPREGHETLADVVTARTLHIDRMIERALPGLEQLVVLGAGYDTRAYGSLKREGLRFFELDRPATQLVKVEALRRAGIDASHVTFVSADLERDRLSDVLLAAGYEPSKRTLFLWEGVTIYLSEGDVLATPPGHPLARTTGEHRGRRLLRRAHGAGGLGRGPREIAPVHRRALHLRAPPRGPRTGGRGARGAGRPDAPGGARYGQQGQTGHLRGRGRADLVA